MVPHTSSVPLAAECGCFARQLCHERAFFAASLRSKRVRARCSNKVESRSPEAVSARDTACAEQVACKVFCCCVHLFCPWILYHGLL